MTTGAKVVVPLDALRILSAKYLAECAAPAQATQCLLLLCLMSNFSRQLERARSESAVKATEELEHAFLALLVDGRALAAELEALSARTESAGLARELDRLLDKLATMIPDLMDEEGDSFSFSRCFGLGAPCPEERLHRLLREIVKTIGRSSPKASRIEQRTSQIRQLLLAQVTEEQRRTPAIAERHLDWPLPDGVRRLIIGLLAPIEGDSVYDPACRTGDLLAAALAESGRDTPSLSQSGCQLYGQARTPASAAIARINLALHSALKSDIRSGDLIRAPQFVHDDDSLQTFTAVACVPPLERLSGVDWGYEFAAQDPYRRFERGLPRRSHGEAAYLLHMVQSMDAERGRMVGVFSQGVLFRTHGEREIRQHLVEEGLVDGVIALPGKLLYETDIPIVVLVLRRPRLRAYPEEVLFVDASSAFKSGYYQNELTEAHVKRILHSCALHTPNEPGFARRVPLEEIKANDYNLRVSRYVAPEHQPSKTLAEFLNEYDDLSEQLRSVSARINERLQDLAKEPSRRRAHASRKPKRRHLGHEH